MTESQGRLVYSVALILFMGAFLVSNGADGVKKRCKHAEPIIIGKEIYKCQKVGDL